MTSYLKPESALKKAEGGFKRLFILCDLCFFLAFCFNKTINAID